MLARVHGPIPCIWEMDFATGPDADLHVDSPYLPLTSFLANECTISTLILKCYLLLVIVVNQETNARLLSSSELAGII